MQLESAYIIGSYLERPVLSAKGERCSPFFMEQNADL